MARLVVEDDSEAELPSFYDLIRRVAGPSRGRKTPPTTPSGKSSSRSPPGGRKRSKSVRKSSTKRAVFPLFSSENESDQDPLPPASVRRRKVKRVVVDSSAEEEESTAEQKSPTKETESKLANKSDVSTDSDADSESEEALRSPSPSSFREDDSVAERKARASAKPKSQSRKNSTHKMRRLHRRISLSESDSEPDSQAVKYPDLTTLTSKMGELKMNQPVDVNRGYAQASPSKSTKPRRRGPVETSSSDSYDLDDSFIDDGSTEFQSGDEVFTDRGEHDISDVGYTDPEGTDAEDLEDDSPLGTPELEVQQQQFNASVPLPQKKLLQMAEEFVVDLDLQLMNLDMSKTGDVSVEFKNSFKSTGGRAHWTQKRGNRPKGIIELGTKIVDTEEKLRNVVAHEFCHLMVFYQNITWSSENQILSVRKTQPHGSEFKKCARDIESKFTPLYPYLKITTKHSYEPKSKYWVCCSSASCSYQFGTNKRSHFALDCDTRTIACPLPGCRANLVHGKKHGDGAEAYKPPKAKAGPNAYSLFVKERFGEVNMKLQAEARNCAGLGPKIRAPDVMKRLAEMWKEMGAEKKEPYNIAAKAKRDQSGKP